MTWLCACSAPPASEGGFDSDNPASQLYAITRAGQTRDRSAVPELVPLLDSDDPAVRMMSIEALECITGQRLGYNPYGTWSERREATEQWQEAVRKGQFVSPPSPIPNTDERTE
ncbi:MAG: hypothetical protein GC164_16445 [Phycisphaera sp.]|nr:hypothetical protein [Phycisphaera sp.]